MLLWGMLTIICREFCPNKDIVLCVIDPHVKQNQIIYTGYSIVVAAAYAPSISERHVSSAAPAPIPTFFLPMKMSYVFPTNREFVFWGYGLNQDLLVWHTKSGDILFLWITQT